MKEARAITPLSLTFGHSCSDHTQSFRGLNTGGMVTMGTLSTLKARGGRS